MDTQKYLQKKKSIFFISLIFIIMCVTLTLLIVYYKDVNTNDELYSENLHILFNNGNGNLRYSEYPLSFQQGVEKSPDNIIKIVNNSEFSTEYVLRVSTKKDYIDAMSTEKIAFSVNDQEGTFLGDKEDGVIYTDSIAPGEEKSINVKFWASKEKLTSDDLDKSIALDLKVQKMREIN